MYEGSMVAIVTPFRQGAFDEDAFRALVDWQIREGTDAIIPCGTTGEAATLTADETARVFRACIDVCKGRVPVIAGTGTNDTRTTIERTKLAKELGADAVLIVTPYYNKPTQEGLIAHFAAIAKEAPIDQILYNVPGRTSVNMLPETVARAAERVPEIRGIKDATADLIVGTQLLEKTQGRISILSGDDFTAFPLWAVGGRGLISVVANCAPKLMSSMWDAWASGDLAGARRLHFRMQPLARALFVETNPIPVKWAVHALGKITDELRLPLTVLSVPQRATVENALREATA
jgi:4-hydroxy-tetrahydrodipicolinate synthase